MFSMLLLHSGCISKTYFALHYSCKYIDDFSADVMYCKMNIIEQLDETAFP